MRRLCTLLRLRSLLLLLALALAAGCTTQGSGEAADPDAAQATLERVRVLFGTLPTEASNPANALSEAKIELGRMLYYDTRLSKNHDISCNSCHQLDRFGVDGEATSPGHRGQRGDRNSPTVYNAALHLAQFWDGRAADVEEQAQGPVLNSVEMALPSAESVDAVLASIPGYAPLFAAAFPDAFRPLGFVNAARAIAAFERRLLTPGRFDRFLEGDLGALSAPELRGLELFVDTGCTACHMGATVGGQLYQKLGLVHAYATEDLGRGKLTGNPAEAYFFKVPSLRNVAETGPWFHDGSVQSLDEAVRLMAWHQLGRELGPEQRADLVAFLGSLTGEIDADYIARPELPKSSASTPAPDPS